MYDKACLKLENIQLPALATSAEKVIDFAKEQAIWIFEGEMGAGKTTFIKAICQQLGVEDTVQSPTFALVNEYDAKSGLIYHFDFYRIEDEAEAEGIGLDEYFYSGNLCLIEWASLIPNLLPEHYARISLSKVNELDARTIEVSIV